MKSIEQLNIAHVVYSFDFGGLERRILRLIDGLSPMGAQFHIISLRPSEGKFLNTAHDVHHHNLYAKPGIDIPAIFRLAKYLRDNDIHIVHSHNWVSMLEGIVGGRIARVPVVIHGEHGMSRFDPDKLRWRRTMTQILLSRLADLIIPVNEAIAARVKSLWHLSSGKVTPISNGVDTEIFAPVDKADSGPVVIGSISRLEAIKDFPCLIRAAAELNSTSDMKYQLIIVGEGSEYPALNSLIRELHAEDYVSLAGSTETPEKWYPKFDVYVNCSISEGMSNTVLEAMSCGLPIVASDVAGHREWLVENENAVFSRPGDEKSLARAIGSLDIERRRISGTKNREKVILFHSQNKFIDEYLAIYQQLLRKEKISFDIIK